MKQSTTILDPINGDSSREADDEENSRRLKEEMRKFRGGLDLMGRF